MIQFVLHGRARSASVVAMLLSLACAPAARAAGPAATVGTHGTAATASAPAVAATPPAAAATPPAPAPSAALNDEAATHFKRGLQLFDEGDYTLALVEFERAYQLAPNYRALYNIALVDVQLGRYADAARTFEQYLHDGGTAIAPARQTEVNKSLNELKLRTATVEISTNAPGAEVTLDGKPLDPAVLKGAMVIDAGEHTLRATAPGYGAANKTVTLAGTDRATVRLDLVALAQPKVPGEVVEHHTVFWPGFAVAGTLVAGAITSGVIMLDAHARWTDLENTPTSSQSDRTLWANRTNSAALVADVFSGLAVVTGGISIYLSLRPDKSSRSPSLAISSHNILFSEPF